MDLRTIELGALADNARLKDIHKSLTAYRRLLGRDPECYSVNKQAWVAIQSCLVGWNERRVRIGQPRIEAVTLKGVPICPARRDGRTQYESVSGASPCR